jgi:hypothetical protein
MKKGGSEKRPISATGRFLLPSLKVVPSGFDSDSNRTLQAGVEPPRLSAFMFQTALHELAGLRIYHRYLLLARVQIATYNHHRSAPFLRALVA